MSAALSDVLVVSLEQAVAAPLASRLLADAGARVIKLERAEGDFARKYDDCVGGEASYFVWLNRGKESVTVDIKDPADQALVQRIVSRADVYIQNLAPGASARAGLGSQALREASPRLITCDISGYGETGDYARMKAYDFLVQAEVGLAGITGVPGNPSRVGISIADIGCGTQAAMAIFRALYEREKTGRGEGIEVSLFGALADWMNVPYLQNRYGGRDIGPVGLMHPSIAPYGAFSCADGTIIIGIQNEREWTRFCAVFLGDEAIATDPKFVSNVLRVENRDACDALIQDRFSSLTMEAAATLLGEAGVAFGRLNDLPGLAQHPAARFVTVSTSSGSFEVLAPGTGPASDQSSSRPPELGEHSQAVRSEFSEAD